jgi:hypothetical protein
MVNNMASDREIINEAFYYLENDVTIEQASKDLGISKRTLQLHLQKLESISPLTFALVKDKKLGNERRGKVKGGTLGKRGTTWTEEQALGVAQAMINGGLTYAEAESVLGIPSSTIHEMIHKGVKDPDTISLLYALTEANKRQMSVAQFQEQHSSEHVASDQVAREIRDNSLSGKKAK